MKFDELDKKMRVFETAHDQSVLPGIYIVVRLDGRSFTRLTKEVHQFEAPFDIVFRDYMVETAKHLMNCGFKVNYAYTQSDEISLLLDLDVQVFQRKERKIISVLAGEGSAKFSLQMGDIGVFDARISRLPRRALVVDYFRWRNEDAHRNALNAHCYWILRKEGHSAKSADKKLVGLSVAAKNELLFIRGINFNNIPNWQKRGTGIYWEEYEIEGENPMTGEKAPGTRKRLKIDYGLPMKQEYSEFLKKLLFV